MRHGFIGNRSRGQVELSELSPSGKPRKPGPAYTHTGQHQAAHVPERREISQPPVRNGREAQAQVAQAGELADDFEPHVADISTIEAQLFESGESTEEFQLSVIESHPRQG